MKKRMTAAEIECKAAAKAAPNADTASAPSGEAMRMLLRRGLRPEASRRDLPFSPGLEEVAAEPLAHRLHHYAFRLFLRGAIRKPLGFAPRQATHYLSSEQSRAHAEFLVDVGLAVRMPRGRYRLTKPPRSFGGTLEWYVARELRRRYGFDVATGVKLHTRHAEGDLDVVAAAEGKLMYVELKSSPPKHLSAREVAAFFRRLRILRPDLALFVMDTALRLSDKVVPMLFAELQSCAGSTVAPPAQVASEIWSLTPHLYAVNARRDLMSNIGRAIARALSALSPLAPMRKEEGRR